MEANALLLAGVGGLLVLAVLFELSRPSTPPPMPTFVMMPPVTGANWGCGSLILAALLLLAAFAAVADFLGLLAAN